MQWVGGSRQLLSPAPGVIPGVGKEAPSSPPPLNDPSLVEPHPRKWDKRLV
jgi:hypothetical protein